jgi:hypothetical protein
VREIAVAAFGIDQARRLIDVDLSGSHDLGTPQAHLQKMRAAPGFDPSFNQIVDCRSASLSGVSFSDLKEFVKNIFSVPGKKIAILCIDEMDWVFLKLYSTYMEAYGNRTEVKLFRDRNAALDWVLER